MEVLVRNSFWDLFRPGCNEHFLVHKLREHNSFVPELSLIAERDGCLAGCIYYAKAVIEEASGSEFPVLTFGPLAVSPEFQKQGIGSELVIHSVEKARNAGYAAIIIYGNPAYYSRFGFVPGRKFGISDGQGNFYDALQVLELQPGALSRHQGYFREGPAYNLDLHETNAFDATFPPRKKHAYPTQMSLLWNGKIQTASDADFGDIIEIINDAASAYKVITHNVIRNESYISYEALRAEIDGGIKFYCYSSNGLPIGVVGLQDKGDVELIRHAYVRSSCQRLGIGSKLLRYLCDTSIKPLLLKTYANASWAINFYQKLGFQFVVDSEKKIALLRKYWLIQESLEENSVLLLNSKQDLI
ncbi:MAG: acetyltransferase [Chloroflexi bacterium ADurb.Bin344]|nr:MAG: acetyltransferase [Chloroflexi bacterium ADurb.Bin344]